MAVRQGIGQLEYVMNREAGQTVVRNIEFKQCGEENAFFYPATKNIVMCYEFINLLERRIGGEAEARAKAQFLAMVQVILHEYGHALSDGQYGASVFENPEDSADAVSAVIMRKSGMGVEFLSAVVLGMRGALVRDLGRLGHNDVHGYDTKRRANLICWTAGGDHAVMREAVNLLFITRQRADQCGQEAQEVERRVDRIMEMYKPLSGGR